MNLPATSPEALAYFYVFGQRQSAEELAVVRIVRCLVNAILSQL